MAAVGGQPVRDFYYFWEEARKPKAAEAPSNWKTPIILGGIFLILVLGLLIFSFMSGNKVNVLSVLNDASLRVPLRS